MRSAQGDSSLLWRLEAPAYLAMVVAITALWAVNCRQTLKWGTPEFNAEVFRLMKAKRCEKAIELVEAANARHDPQWYSWLVGLELDCLAKFGGTHGETALRLVDEGIQRFPKSSELLYLKGFAYGRMGERGLADKYRDEALRMAVANIAADPEGRNTAGDRRVMKNAEASRAAWEANR